MKNKYCICVDWLEVSCYGGFISKEGFYIDGKYYSVVREERETAMFKRYYIVKFRGLDIAYIRQEPRLQRMKKGLTCVKLSNRVLYCEDYIPILMGILKSLNLRYHGLTRLDIAFDCNYFCDGRKPSKFVRDYVFKPLDEIGGVYLAGCKTFKIHGGKSIGDDGTINYLSFGSNSSCKRGYIYDKTKELQEVKDKPWIRDMWQKNGLISDDKMHVWRSEISIKCQGKDLLNLDTGQLFPLHPNYLATYENVKKIFHFYAAKVFDFRINQGQKNRRNFSRLNLFDKAIDITCLPKRVNNACDSGRSEKACKNKLERLSRTYVDLSEGYRSALAGSIEFLSQLSSIKAARYGSEQYKQYLDVFASCRFLSDEDIAYFMACDEACETRRAVDPDRLYQLYLNERSRRALVELEIE